MDWLSCHRLVGRSHVIDTRPNPQPRFSVLSETTLWKRVFIDGYTVQLVCMPRFLYDLEFSNMKCALSYLFVIESFCSESYHTVRVVICMFLFYRLNMTLGSNIMCVIMPFCEEFSIQSTPCIAENNGKIFFLIKVYAAEFL